MARFCGLLIVLLLFGSGCAAILGLPQIESKDMAPLMEKLSASSGSACLSFNVSGGGGAMTVAPVPIPGGGYGSGGLIVGRVNSDNTTMEIKNGECRIERGSAETKVKDIQ